MNFDAFKLPAGAPPQHVEAYLDGYFPINRSSLRRDFASDSPRIAIVAGSGLGGLNQLMQIGLTMDASGLMLEDRLETGIDGHSLKWHFGRAGEIPIVLLAGRRHLYEGIDPYEAGVPMRQLAELGVRLVIITNAAGGLSPNLQPGDLMLIRDQINFMFSNPCRRQTVNSGADHPDGLARDYPAQLYDAAAQAMVRRSAVDQKVALKEGIYASVPGPNYETCAEVEFLRIAGADAVGMSTVPEVLAARQAGMSVIGISVITNSHCGRRADSQPVTHDDVLAQASQAEGRLLKLLKGALPRLNELAGRAARRAVV